MPEGGRAQKWLSDWRIAAAICVGCLLLRSWFFIAWEESYFDSDQAIVGLMAKHLAEGRAKPLFFYGQEYMLGVESWVAAPFIGLFGASVASFRVALVALNLATGLLLLRLLVSDSDLSLWRAAAASSLFWIAPMASASLLVEGQGGNIEPFLWVLIAWVLRRWPLALGACLATAFLNREFSAYAVPMLLLVDLIERRAKPRDLALDWTKTAAAFLIVFPAVELAKPHADLLGPGTSGIPVFTGGENTIALALGRVHWNPGELGARFHDLITDYVPTLFGLKWFYPANVAIATDVRVGIHAFAPLVGLLALVAVVLLAMEVGQIVRQDRRWLFPFYLMGIGVTAAIVYPLTRPLSVFTLRYGLLVLYAPIGLSALMLDPARRVVLQWTAAAALGLLAILSTLDHVRVLARAEIAPPASPMRQIIRRLEARHVTVALADYWRAYLITFLSGEKIKVAATDYERISEYKTLVDGPVDAISPGGVVMIQKQPCARGDGDRAGGFYLCDRR